MKKIAKLSLVAAVAVAGLTTANAQQLEDAIKKVEVSGSVVYRYNDYNTDVNDTNTATTGTGGASNGHGGTEAGQTNNYKAALNLAAPVNDFVKLNTRFLVASTEGDFASLETSDGSDGNVNVTLSNVYFGYTGIKNTTVNVGKQGLTTPWTVAVQADGNEQTGTGALALTTIDNVTLAAGYFNQTNLGKSGQGIVGLLDGPAVKKTAYMTKDPITGKLDTNTFDSDTYNDDVSAYNTKASNNANTIGSLDIATVGTIVAAGPVTLDAWYADMQETFSSYTLGAKASTELAGITFGADARYTSLQLDRNVAERLSANFSSYDSISATRNESNVHDDNSLAKLALTAKAGILSGKAVYGKTGKEGGLTALDFDASTTLLGWSATTNGKADADFYQLVAAVDILPELNLSANYVNIDYTVSDTVTKNANGDVTNSTVKSAEEEEIYAQLTYKMSKNLTSYIRYGVYSKDTSDHVQNTQNANHGDSRADNIDDTRGRIQDAYTF